jgi:hypothetical protein
MADTLPRPLFSTGEAEDRAYCNLYNVVSPEARVGRKFAERLWTQYWPYADATFLTEIRRDFHARFWEMYLTCALLQQSQQHGYAISCPKRKKRGVPDILVEYGDLRIWIEAVTATARVRCPLLTLGFGLVRIITIACMPDCCRTIGNMRHATSQGDKRQLCSLDTPPGRGEARRI